MINEKAMKVLSYENTIVGSYITCDCCNKKIEKLKKYYELTLYRYNDCFDYQLCSKECLGEYIKNIAEPYDGIDIEPRRNTHGTPPSEEKIREKNIAQAKAVLRQYEFLDELKEMRRNGEID